MDERSIEEQDHLERVISVEEDDDDSDLDMEEFSDEFTSIPAVEVDREWKRTLRKPWRNALIIKLLGKSISYSALIQRLTTMWNLDEDFDCIDLGHGFYVVKFSSAEDLLEVITGGSLEDYGSLADNTKMEAEFSSDYGNDCIRSSVDSIAWFTFGIFQ
ncbi:hypothetical protein J1N35_033738 [Gossypium stocksii]|uniref:DUF4283 domain-containing protein n=1 Tax=Gossypium stocksii TaxID=47602 RepID=A0A9D3ZPK0_9ROSI|nr:hypothetical protein J1N35_033738 [Gossypium stocksii]